jgi:Flp pilus assembly protein TadB
VLYYLVEGAAERRAQYPKLRRSIATRALAIVGGLLLVAGAALTTIAALAGLARTSLAGRLGGLGLAVGGLLLIAALIVWLVRSARNRRAHPISSESAPVAAESVAVD